MKRSSFYVLLIVGLLMAAVVPVVGAAPKASRAFEDPYYAAEQDFRLDPLTETLELAIAAPFSPDAPESASTHEPRTGSSS